MARGWESKSVEAQMEEAADARRSPRGEALTPEQLEKVREKGNLTLSRKRVQHELDHSSSPRYAKLLKKSIRELDRRLKELG
ncbi:MAG: hypothetical protein HYR60_03765 [Acidobacteria bacterium]|nr:hypothetical protein [Acidobacteriota bacterium]MBI3470663.1 hypothetical protein [Candidatus Solibacter usitatus]